MMDFENRTGNEDFDVAEDVANQVQPRGPAVPLAGATVLTPDAQGVVVLPAGVELEDLQVVGRDLVIVAADGTRYVVLDGAIIVPQLVVGGVAIPPVNLAALLLGDEPEPAAGNPQSSGGNFAGPVGDIQSAYDLGDLLPYTELAFPQAEEREIIPDVVDRDPDVVIQDGGPVGRDVTDAVNEAGLPAIRPNGNRESAGSNAGSGAHETSGTIFVTSPDGIAAITINGVPVTGQAGQQIVTSSGTLTLGALTDGQIVYTYTLNDNTSGDNTTDVFTVIVTDPDGDQATARLTMAVTDDVPTARADTDGVAAGTYGPETGNVMSGAGTTSGSTGADTPGADGATVTGVHVGASGTFAPPGTILGQYGTLTIDAAGNYSYTRAEGSPGGADDVFTYRITDGDGDSSTATLTIRIADSPAIVISVPETGDGTIVDEDGLPPRGSEPPGSEEIDDGNADNDSDEGEATSGTITFAAPDGPPTVTINGVVITGPGQTITVPQGTLTITGYDPQAGTIGYTFTLGDNTSGDDTSATFTVTVTDVDGDSDSAEFTIHIIDDVPEAVDDFASQSTENAPVIINVLANDTPGADGVALSQVAFVSGSLIGAGTVAYNGDGTFTYTPAPGELGVATFDYTITDGDGDTSTATVSISLAADSEPVVSVTDGVVDEAALGDGSNPASTAETDSGTISIATGGDTIASLVINGVDVTGGGVVNGTYGTLTVSLSSGNYSWSYTLGDNTLDHPTNPSTGTAEGIFDSFTVDVTDSDGDIASDTLTIDVLDDGPTANGDVASPAQDTPVVIDVFANDEAGADGVNLATGVALATGPVQGSVVYNGDGTFTYTPAPGATGSDSFTYTITDGDGDTSTATVSISLAADSEPVVSVTDGVVDEAALGDGSNPASTAETDSGTISIATGGDTIASLVINGVDVTGGGVVNGTYGTLTVSLSSGNYSWSYTLGDNTLDHPTNPSTGTAEGIFDSFTVDVTDSDGDIASDTLTIDVLDDGPTANGDVASPAQDTPVVIDVFANDEAGADGVNLATGVALATGPVQGSVVYNGDGTFTYTPAPGATGSDSFTYTITDGDGDTSTATVSISLAADSEPVVSVTDGVVDEAALGDGSNPASTAETDSGTISIATGGDTIASLVINGVDVTGGGVVNGTYGTLTVSLSSGNYSWSYTLGDNTLDHPTNPSTGTAEGIFDSFTVDVTDSDGDIASDTLTIDVLDDGPDAVNDATNTAEDTQVVYNVIANDTQGADTPAVLTAASLATAGAGTVTFAANGDVTFMPAPGFSGDAVINYTIEDADGDPSSAILTVTVAPDSKPSASAVTAAVDDDGLTGPPAGNPASMTDDLASNYGADGVVGGGDDDLDGAGSSEATFSGNLGFSYGGDGPASAATDFVFANATGVTIGQEDVDLAWDSGSSTLTATIATGPRIGLVLFTVVVDEGTGAYTVTLERNVLHAAGPDDEGNPDPTLALTYTVTDSDGSPANGSLTITFDDDAPTATAENGSVQENTTAVSGTLTFAQGADGASVTHIDGNALTFDAVTDWSAWIQIGAGQVRVKATGEYEFLPDAAVTGTGSADATFTITDGDGDTASLAFHYDVTDKSTPSASAVTAAVDDDGLTGPPAGNPASMTDDLASNYGADGVVGGGDDDLDGAGSSEATFSGNLGFSYGGDGPASAATDFVFANATGVTIGQEDVDLAWDSGSSTLTATIATGPRIGLVLFTVVVDEGTGAYTVTLERNVLHAAGPDDEGNPDPTLALTYTVTDSDGSPANGSLTITFDDDAPTATAENGSVQENTTAVSGTLTFAQGADGASVTHIDGNALTFDAVTDWSAWIQIGAGQVRVKATGEYEFLPDAAVTGTGSADATFTITDGDGDTASLAFHYDVTDKSTPSASAVTAAVDDDGLTGPPAGNPASMTDDLASNYGADGVVGGGDDDLDGAGSSEATFSGNLGFSYGGDGPASAATDFVFANATGVTIGQEDVDLAWDSGSSTLTATIATGPRIGLVLFTVVVDEGTGAYTVTLERNVLHAAGPDDEGNPDPTLALTYTVTDSDGSPANGSLTITFDDDAPTATAENGSVQENTTAVSGTLTFAQGADGASVTHIDGNALTFDAVTDWSAWIQIGAGQVRVKATGEYEFLPDAAVTGTGSADATFTITDGDGDTASLAFHYDVTDKSTPSASAVTAAVDDDGLTGPPAGNPASMTDDLASNYGADGVVGGGDDDLDGAGSSEATFSGNLGFSYGGDGPASAATDFVFANATGVTIGQEDVDLAWDSGSSTLTATIATGPRIGLVLFTVVVDEGTGAYTVTLERNVLHAAGPDDEGNPDPTLALTYTVTDSDGSPANGSLTITFDDDAPTATAENGSVQENTTAVSGTLTFAQGADGASVTHIDGNALTFDAVTDWSAWIQIGAGQVRVKATGEYEFLPDAAVTGTGSADATFTITDGDGDTASLAFHYDVTDKSTPSASAVTAAVDDDGLTGPPAGNPASMTDDLASNYGADGVVGGGDDDLDGAGSSEATFSGNLGFSYGGDGPASAATDFVFANATGVTIGQEDVDLAWDSGSSTLTATIATGPRIGLVLFTVVVDEGTGAYTVTLERNVLHAAGPDDEGSPDPTLALTYTVTDSDGSPANGSLTITFDDDAPTATAENGSVQENTTAVSGTLTFAQGADGASVTHIDGNALTFDAVTDWSAWIQIGAGQVRVKATGEYEFLPDAAVTGTGSADATFTITDGDGDTASLAFHYDVTDKSTPSASAVTAAVDDDGLTGPPAGNLASMTDDLASNYGADGVVGGGDDDLDGAGSSEATFSGNLGFSYGGDGPASAATDFVFANATGVTIGQEDVDLAWDSGSSTLTATIATGPRIGLVLFTVVVDEGTGAYTVTLERNVLHAAGPDDEGNPDPTLALTYTVTDSDGSPANGSLTITFDDDAPTASVSVAGLSISIDESANNQVDSNDVTGPLTVFDTVNQKGDDPDVPGAVIQYAQGTGAVSSTGSVLGADGGAVAFSLDVSSPGVDSLLTTTAGTSIYLYKEGDLIVGRVGGSNGDAAFAVAINATTGQISMVQYLSIQHNLNGASADDSVSIATGAILATVTATDGDLDEDSASTAIGNLISFQDSGPVMTAAQNMNIQNAGDFAHTATFAYDLGADGARTDNDVFKTVTFSAKVNGTTVQTTTPLTQASEDADMAVFNFSFDYSTGSGTATATGTITFWKTSTGGHTAGTYTVDLAGAIQGVTLFDTGSANASSFVGYDAPSQGGGSKEIVVAQIGTDYFMQFTGDARPNNAGSTMQTKDYNAGAGADTDPNQDWYAGELFDANTAGYPALQVSNSAVGVSSNVLQTGEVIDFNLYSTNPGGTLNQTPTQTATEMFMTFFQVDAADDLIVILKLYDTVLGTYTTKAIIVDSGDMYLGSSAADKAALASTTYANLAAGLGNQDALMVIQANDYQEGNTNLVIVGAQIVTSPDGVSGTGIDLNRALGSTGGSSTTLPFSSDTDTSGIKVTSIGFPVPSTTNQNAELTFNVTIQDGDNDAISQSLTATVTQNADSTSAVTLGGAVTTVVPLVLDLNGDGVTFVDRSAEMSYDYDGDDIAENTAWAGNGDGILAVDLNSDGMVSGANEFVFGGNGMTDLEGLANDYDGNGDGILDARDSAFAQFGVWQDANGNGVSDAGEFRSLADAGIVSLGLTSDGQAYAAAGGDVTVFGTATYIRADGTVGHLADASFAVSALSEQKTSQTITAIAVAATGLLVPELAAASENLALADQPLASPSLDAQDQIENEGGFSTHSSFDAVELSYLWEAPTSEPQDGETVRELVGSQEPESVGLPDIPPVAAQDAAVFASSEPAAEFSVTSSSQYQPESGAALMEALLGGAAQHDNQTGNAYIEPVKQVFAEISSEATIDALIDRFIDGGADLGAIVTPVQISVETLASALDAPLSFGGTTMQAPDAVDDAAQLAAAVHA